MFGAKFKKWIEIVNPRKKSNKKKNGNSGNIISQQHIPNDYKGVVFQNETTSISSPARRSEISPIQNHNGRRGWHSPNQDNPSSTTPKKLDCPPLLTISKTNDVHRLKNENLTNNCANDLKKSINTINNYLPTAPTSITQMKEIDQSMMHSNMSSTTKNHKSTSNVNNNTININKNRLYSSPLYYSTTATNSSNELLNDAHTYLNGSSSSSVNSTKLKIHNDTNDNNISTTKQQRCEESQYGKIQPINKYISKYRFFSTKTASASPSSTTIDQYNGNSSDDFYSVEYAAKTLPKSAITTTTTTTLFHDSHTKMLRNCDENKISNEHADNSIKRSNEYNYRNATVNSPSHNYGISLKPPSLPCLAPLKHNSTIIQQQGQQNSQNRLSYHIINHVSSPESAYSTGYSTDGNSPGGCPPAVDSYYINIRTGIHYFPRSQNSSNTCNDSNFNRFKSDLNRIEEKNDEQIFNSHKRADSFDMGKKSKTFSNEAFRKSNIETHAMEVTRCQSPILRKNILEMSQLRTPSPRQRSRIRTNPWISIESEAQNLPCKTFDFRTNFLSSPNKRDRDSTGSTTSSSGINLVSNSDSNEQKREISDSETSSTEKPSKMLKSPKLLVKPSTKKDLKVNLPISISTTQHEGSDDDATLNEIGKFDESYVYEKENDFLSDSDRTDCVSDLGQEAEDECESTDDILDSNASGKKALNNLNDNYKNKMMNIKSNKELMKKRKKFVRKRSKHLEITNNTPTVSRGSKSVGGTPVSIRRNEKMAERRHLEPLLSNRSNSLTFNEVHMIHNRMLAISNSEKALIKADLEADVKYRQLINEAESILISMKSNLIVPKETISTSAISSPRKNVPTNKRVEMLRNCEFDLKRELAKSSNKTQEVQPTLINKRLEQLRYDLPKSAPTSPKPNRITPMKTHVTNFICQNEKDLTSSQNSQKSLNSLSSTSLRNKSLPFKKCIDSDSESENVKLGAHIVINNEIDSAINKIPLFRSVMRNNDDMFFPQSEPLKRKIYSRNSKMGEIQQSGKEDFDSDLPKKALLHKIEMLRKERQQKSKDSRESSSDAGDVVSNDSPKRVINESFKRKLIMKTIEDIKRSLEDQSLELNELHDSDT